MRILIITQYFWPENFRINEVSEDKVKKFGIRDEFYTKYGDVNDARKYFGLDVESITKTIEDNIK